MLQEMMTIVEQIELAPKIYKLRLTGELVKEMNKPGQFLNILAPRKDLILRRPISIAEILPEKKECVIIYRVEGEGTESLSQLKAKDKLDVMGPLGNGFPLETVSTGQTAYIVGGGIGIPPLYELSKQLIAKGVKVEHFFGFSQKNVIFYQTEFEALGKVHIATDDGSYGLHGHIGHLFEKQEDAPEPGIVFACGPTGLLKAVESRYEGKNAFLSLEERMACGMGACYACVCHKKGDQTGIESLKVCDEGPVFKAGEVVL